MSKCSHGASAGPLDEEQRFYLESRGIEPATAERLLVDAFFQEVVTLPVAERSARRVTELLSASWETAADLGPCCFDCRRGVNQCRVFSAGGVKHRPGESQR